MFVAVAKISEVTYDLLRPGLKADIHVRVGSWMVELVLDHCFVVFRVVIRGRPCKWRDTVSPKTFKIFYSQEKFLQNGR